MDFPDPFYLKKTSRVQTFSVFPSVSLRDHGLTSRPKKDKYWRRFGVQPAIEKTLRALLR
jgi:hypothetical protein